MKQRKGLVLSTAAVCLAVAIGSAIRADQTPGEPSAPKEVTLTGKIVDLHCYMSGKFPSADQIKCTRDCIKAGVPAALETADGLVILGQGMKGPESAVANLAMKKAEVRGTMYERHGVRYIDIASAREVDEPAPEDEYDETGWSDDPEDPED